MPSLSYKQQRKGNMLQQEKTEMNTLFPEIEVQGYTIKPWTLGDLADMAMSIGQIIMSMRNYGITLEDIEKSIPELITIIFPYAPDIIAKTLKIDMGEARGLDPVKATEILLTILTQNIEHIKNSFGLVGFLRDQIMDSSGQ